MSDPTKEVSVSLKTKRKRDKVCIIGCGASRKDVPYHDDSFEFWGVNNLFLSFVAEAKQTGVDVMEHFTRWFEIHPIEKGENGFIRRGKERFRGQPVNGYMNDLKAMGDKYGIPVYMMQQWKEVPLSTAYPIDAIIKTFPRRYFTNTVAYQVALAIAEGFKEIRIYGVDMAVSSVKIAEDEYSWQRPSCEYFIGIAEGRGIKVYLPPESDMLKARFLYAYDEPGETEFDQKLDSIATKLNGQFKKAEQEIVHFRNEIAHREAKLNQIRGSLNCIVEIQKLWAGGNGVDITQPWQITPIKNKAGAACTG